MLEGVGFRRILFYFCWSVPTICLPFNVVEACMRFSVLNRWCAWFVEIYVYSGCVCVYIYLQCLKSHLKCKTDNESPFWANLHIRLLYTKDYNDTDFLFYFRICTNQLSTNILIKHFPLLGNFGAHSLYKHIVFFDFKGHIFNMIHGCITPVSCHAQKYISLCKLPFYRWFL